MRILFTGASSFTGYWFAKELAAAGHDVSAVFRRRLEEYAEEPRGARVRALHGLCRPLFGVSFGDDSFLQLIEAGNWDLFCHHAADATDYRSPDFNVIGAVDNNTRRLRSVLTLLKDRGCTKVVFTGSVFENDEGAGSGSKAFSPYGLSKGISWQIFRYYAETIGLSLGKFIIPNPFGPYEEPRFTNYLVRSWFRGETPSVNTPDYVRDNIHVSLLAKAYVEFVAGKGAGNWRLHPSGYIESQGAFTARFAREMRDRLGLKCQFLLKAQTDFSEPRIRINTDVIDGTLLNWNEKDAWDELADYYRRSMAPL